MAIIQDWMPPSRENWELVTFLWQFFPLVLQDLHTGAELGSFKR